MVDPNAPAWHVTTQTEGMGLGPNGGAVKGVTIGFQLADGTSGSVFVTDPMFTPDNVKAAIAARAAVLAQVKGLSG